METVRSEVSRVTTQIHELYPEVCEPVRRLEGVPQRAKTMLGTGTRFDNGEVFENASISFVWCGNEIALPNVPGSFRM